MRFIIVGYYEDWGYGIKDLQDGIVEYFNEKEVLDMSKEVEIYGVESGKINLDWFGTYYLKYVMLYGIDKAVSEFGIIYIDGEFSLCYIYTESVNFRFIEFIENFSLIVRVEDLNTFRLFSLGFLCDSLVSGRTSLFHLKKKVASASEFDGGYINRLNVQNILQDNAVLDFTCFSDIVIDNLKMHNCVYRVSCYKDVYLLCDLDDSTKIHIEFLSGDCTCYIGNNFKLDSLVVNGLAKVSVQDNVDLNKVSEIFSKGNNISEENYYKYYVRRDSFHY